MSQLPDTKAAGAAVRYRVLVVDDEPTLRLGFSYALSDHDTDTAAGGVEALSKLENESYDLVILDLRMPDIDGLRVIESLRRHGNSLPVVLCSAVITPSAALRAITGQVVDFLLKPVHPKELRGVVKHVMAPGGDGFALAMAQARAGRHDEAVRALQDLGEESERVQAWLGILRAIRMGSLEGEAAAFGRLEKEGLSALAFRAA
ncbi:response regulator [Luteolibacter sp. GHJ8]|uniref:Response regulator n=1 Tax=Luteolibacter rhizosphaerae TaxID=2989719 RepID=A0ABT3G588_9BACT|nr:response regulator [Luteolibacter rhizosphaerae]MCW1914973.1 response regulator [Luteolibacter rhizosphaerae]